MRHRVREEEVLGVERDGVCEEQPAGGEHHMSMPITNVSLQLPTIWRLCVCVDVERGAMDNLCLGGTVPQLPAATPTPQSPKDGGGEGEW